MKSGLRLIRTAPFLLAAATGVLFSAPLERSLSTSRQFIIYGTNVPFRGFVSDLAEQTKARLLQAFEQRDNWKTPIIINLQVPQANLPDIPPVELRFSQTGFGLKLQLDLTISDPGNALRIQREVLRAILMELIYRNQPDIAPGTLLVQPPHWLLEGLLAITSGQDKAALMESIVPLVTPDKVIGLEEFLQQNPSNLDSPGRSIYRAYAFTFLKFLLSEPGGRLRLFSYVTNLARASNDQLADLRAHFAVLESPNADADWRSFVRNFSSPDDRFHLLTFAETENRLGELLQVRIPDANRSGKDVPWEDCLRRKATPAQAATLQVLSRNLTVLTASANPVMRPIVAEYEEIMQLLARGKRARLTQRLARLKGTREKLVARMTEIDDYMNWFEATQLNSKSGAFTGYLKAAEDSSGARRHDPLSVYLDAVEQQFQNDFPGR
jgi:hypothetical protein